MDYVIVGAGSAGSVLANKLSADPAVTVTLLEAGPPDKNKFIRIPAGFKNLFRSEVDWDYLTEPQPALNNRQIYWPRGKTLGGSSSMNAMMWVRGYNADYDDWADATDDPGWGSKAAVDVLDDVDISVSEQRSPRASTASYLTAARQAGYSEGFTQTLVTQRDGRRHSAADAYLKPAANRPNLTVLTDAHATKVVFDGVRATGVEYLRHGQRHTISAQREVVLCGGAINTPQLLMLSGIGDRAQLDRHGIALVAHSPEVGENLIDHLVAGIGYGVASGSLFGADKKLSELWAYFVRHRGALTSNVGEAYGFVRSQPQLALPDLELVYAPAPFYYEGLQDPTEHGVTLAAVLLKPASRGRITLASDDPLAKPVIDPQYLSDPAGADRAALLAGLRACAEVAGAPSLSAILGPIIYPPEASDDLDAALTLALEQYSHTLYHPVGTARMGSDTGSVVTPTLEVRGVRGLRVADASVMPSIIRGHTHAPSVFIGHRAAELLVR